MPFTTEDARLMEKSGTSGVTPERILRRIEQKGSRRNTHLRENDSATLGSSRKVAVTLPMQGPPLSPQIQIEDNEVEDRSEEYNDQAENIARSSTRDDAINLDNILCSIENFQVRKVKIEKLDLMRGELVAVVGASGIGKTTFMEILAIRRRVDFRGDVLYRGNFPGGEMNGTVCWCEQYPKASLLDGITPLQSLDLSAKLFFQGVGVTEGQRKNYIRDFIKMFGLAECRNTNVRYLSGGQVKRLAVAFALIKQPSIIIMDEPLSGLADSDCMEVMDAMRRYADQFGACVILSLHQPSTAIYRFLDRIGNISHKGVFTMQSSKEKMAGEDIEQAAMELAAEDLVERSKEKGFMKVTMPRSGRITNQCL